MSTLTRTILTTGGASGLGYQSALELARQRPEYRILIASRSDPDSAAAAINKALGQNTVQHLPLDLSSFANIRAFAVEYARRIDSSVESGVVEKQEDLYAWTVKTVARNAEEGRAFETF
jgi:NAD(P)-dependent dehydrogenase (short-subunit alcohol dehydrogenase family)